MKKLSAKERKSLLDTMVPMVHEGPEVIIQHATERARNGEIWFPSTVITSLAVRRGLIEGDLEAMWRGLRQSVRVDWVSRRFGGGWRHREGGYTHVYDIFPALAVGDLEVFRSWLKEVPRRLDDGHPWTVAVSNAVTAWGHDDDALLAQASREVAHRRMLRSTGKHERATLEILHGAFTNNAAMAASGLATAVAEFKRGSPSQLQFSDWFLAVDALALFNLARTRIEAPIGEPSHSRWRSPPIFADEAPEGLIDFSQHLPTLHQWWRELPDEPKRDDWIVGDVPAAEKRSEATEQDLLQAIYADPTEDGPRMVYADWLLERDRVRGEFIMLQMRRARGEKLNRKEAARERELLELHSPVWLGKLADQGVTNTKYERGFLASCWSGSLDANPAWSTLRELYGVIPERDDISLPALRTLGGLWNLKGLEKRTNPLPIESLHFIGLGYLEPPPEFGVTTAVQQLRQVWIVGAADWVRDESPEGTGAQSMGPEHLDWLWNAPAGRNIRDLICPVPFGKLPEFVDSWMASGPKLENLTVSSHAGRAWNGGWQLTLQRSAGDHYGLVVPGVPKSPSSATSVLFEAIARLPSGIFDTATIDSSWKKHAQVNGLTEVVSAHGVGKVNWAKVLRWRSWWE